MNLDIINDNFKLKALSDVLNTYSTITIEKEIQATERTFIREKSRVEIKRMENIKELYMNEVNRSYDEKMIIIKTLENLLLNNECTEEILSACNILLSFREMNNQEFKKANLQQHESVSYQYSIK